MSQIIFADDKDYDALCFGRVGLDLYGMEDGKGLASVSGFRTSLGGSPGNIAVGMARLGCRAGCITKVANDPVGDYVQQTLASEGVDTSYVLRDVSGHLTSLALAAVQPDNCEVVIYRQQAADLQITTDDIDTIPIDKTKILLVSGTALSAMPSRQAALHAMTIARQHQVRVVLDLDYRENTWSSNTEAAAVYQQALTMTDLAIGNSEEWSVVSPHQSKSLLDQYNTLDVLIDKHGSQGCSVHHGQGSQHFAAYKVQARKPYGAGDAFAAALLQQLLTGKSIDQAICWGAASAALIVQSGACALAMPTQEHIQAFIASHHLPEN